ncbi:MAG: hypothetical protein EZS28_039639 [Streblomastix strix]|uniref:Uncharacterized protein n=1 Tax=Streblomastix strix TaxID=222440 RepID=A0A5J4U375_9EUKA|nr:MAG: hypothetical protein EZS28_039639 [Streblomastix strix]
MDQYVHLQRIDSIKYEAILEDHFRKGLDFIATYDDMKKQYADLCPEKNTVYNWEKLFLAFGNITYYTQQPGKPKIKGLGKQIEPYIQQNPSISLRRLHEILGNAKETLARAIDEELDMIKVSKRWVPHNLSRQNLNE